MLCFIGSKLCPRLTLMPPFKAACFSTHLLIEMTKAITMTLQAEQPPLDLCLAPVKDESATLEFKMDPETLYVSWNQLAWLKWANTQPRTLSSARTVVLVLFELFKAR